MADDALLARSVLTDQVKDHLLQAILAGRYPPHSRIVETRVARELGTSQAPVREALRGLEALGLVEILPFRGARVRLPSSDELLEAYGVRAALETLGAELAMRRLTADDVADLATLCGRMQEAATAGEPHEVAIADAAFHGRLMTLSGNATLARVWRSLEPFSRTYITLVAPGANAHWTADLHTPVLEAIRGGDPERVVAAIQRHFDLAAEHLRAGLAEAERQPSVSPG